LLRILLWVVPQELSLKLFAHLSRELNCLCRANIQFLNLKNVHSRVLVIALEDVLLRMVLPLCGKEIWQMLSDIFLLLQLTLHARTSSNKSLFLVSILKLKRVAFSLETSFPVVLLVPLLCFLFILSITAELDSVMILPSNTRV
jgi:hypothetical protein